MCMTDPGKRKKEIGQLIKYVEVQVMAGMRAGADLYEIVDMLTGAKMMLDAGLLDDAETLAEQAGRLAGTRIMQFERLAHFLKQGRRQIEMLTEKGSFTEDALRMLEMAEEAMEASDYEAGIGYAIKCIECTRDIIENRKPRAGN